MRLTDEPWAKIVKDYHIDKHDFSAEPFVITARQIKNACQNFIETGQKEVRILCKQDTRKGRPEIFKKLGVFILPIKNGTYAIIKGEGYMDIPDIESEVEEHESILNFFLDTSIVGNSEMQHVDFAYASSVIRTFMKDPSLVLTIRGRKYTPEFSFHVGEQEIIAKSVQTEVDAGYEGKEQVVLIEAKNSKTDDEIIRQLYYPFRQWQEHTDKEVKTVFFEKRGSLYYLWQYRFKDLYDYNSAELERSARFLIQSSS